MAVRYCRYLAALAAALLALGAAPAWAQTYSPTITLEANLGDIVPAGSTSTDFTFAASTGTVSQMGQAVRRSGGTARVQVTVPCSNGQGNACGQEMSVKIGSIGTPTGKAGPLSAFDVWSAGGSSGTISAISGSNPLTFRLKPQNQNRPAVFYIGATMPIESNQSAGTFGPASSQFYVYVSHNTQTPTAGISGSVTANTYRGLSISATPLSFGKITRPTTGSVPVNLNPDTNVRTAPGSASPTTGASRSVFTITGEKNLTITVTQDSSFQMTGPGAPITVALSRSNLPTAIGSDGSPGLAGTSTFYTGGSFTVGPTQAIGAYSGTFSTTVSYN